jgi:hypothetical protein
MPRRKRETVKVLDMQMDEVLATELMVHHLHLAACLFEGTRDDNNRMAKLLIRRLSEPANDGAARFIDALDAYYKRIAE